MHLVASIDLDSDVGREDTQSVHVRRVSSREIAAQGSSAGVAESLPQSGAPGSRDRHASHQVFHGSESRPNLPAGRFRVDSPKTYAYLRCAVRRACPKWLDAHVDDIVQKAAIRLFRALSSETSNGEVCGRYLYRVASTVVIDEIRHRRRETYQTDSLTAIQNSSSQTPDSPQASPLQQMEHSQIGDAIFDCIAKLNRDRRCALSLQLQGHSCKDIAQRLNWNYKRTENLICRARVAVKKCLEHKGIGLHDTSEYK